VHVARLYRIPVRARCGYATPFDVHLRLPHDFRLITTAQHAAYCVRYIARIRSALLLITTHHLFCTLLAFSLPVVYVPLPGVRYHTSCVRTPPTVTVTRGCHSPLAPTVCHTTPFAPFVLPGFPHTWLCCLTCRGYAAVCYLHSPPHTFVTYYTFTYVGSLPLDLFRVWITLLPAPLPHFFTLLRHYRIACHVYTTAFVTPAITLPATDVATATTTFNVAILVWRFHRLYLLFTVGFYVARPAAARCWRALACLGRLPLVRWLRMRCLTVLFSRF